MSPISKASALKPSFALQWLYRLRKPHRRQAGLSLIECIVAIVIISLTVVTIIPTVFLATATRVQARKFERANQIAQGELDRIRNMVERGTYTLTTLPGDAGSGKAVKDVGVASGFSAGALLSPASCSTYPPAATVAWNKLVAVDADGDCTPDFAMQVFRTTGLNPVGTNVPSTFEMGVRVYTYSATMPTLLKERASAVPGTGARENSATSRRPMAVLYSAVARNDNSKTLCFLREQAGGPACTE